MEFVEEEAEEQHPAEEILHLGDDVAAARAGRYTPEYGDFKPGSGDKTLSILKT
ncbi:MAG TPA: hypothetical protein VIP11_16245 [Gemmatimonadaceae bacterium]